MSEDIKAICQGIVIHKCEDGEFEVIEEVLELYNSYLLSREDLYRMLDLLDKERSICCGEEDY